jgi:5-methylcytosine-specific restriction endonuclease McrA
MRAKLKSGRAWLLANAKAVAEELAQRSQGTRLRIRPPSLVYPGDTGGWYAVLGDLGRKQARLEVWFDRFTGYQDRRLYAGFYSGEMHRVTAITKRVSKRLWPIRVITFADTDRRNYLVLRKRLPPSEFNAPILEKYSPWTYFGLYSPASVSSSPINRDFRSRAVAFFEEVARSLPRASPAEEYRDVYSQFENRRRVVSHLVRERSGLLAAERKIRDNYRCQACDMTFESVYGRELGKDFAEAHHLVPLGKLRGRVRTRIEDLRTVCANCHRMLHRMTGKRDDLGRLREIVQRHSGKRDS